MFYKETNFKESPIGRIPKEWEVVRLGDVVSLEYGKGLPENERIPGEYPVVGSNGIVGYHNQALVEGPGIVIGRKGTIGAVTWVDSDFWPIDTTYYVKTKRDDTNLRWLFYELTYLNPSRFKLSDVVPGLKRELVYSMITSIPPLPEQQKIAEVLSAIDAAIEQTDAVIAKIERLKKGLMQELLMKGLGHKEFKETEIGRIPKDWEVVRLGDVLTLKNGERPQMIENGQHPVYGANGVMGYSDDYLVNNDFTIVIGRVGASGEVHLGRGEIWISDNAIYSEKYDGGMVYPPFIYYLLKLRQLNKFATKTTHPIITQNFLKSLQIPLPPLEEQQKIAEILSAIDERLEIERIEKVTLERIKREMMNLLLTGKVRVKCNENR